MKKILPFIAGLAMFSSAHAQFNNDEIEVVLSDLLIIFDDFSSPAARAGIQQTTAGYYTRADSVQLFQVKLGVGTSMLPFGSSEKQFTIRDSQFQNINIVGATEATIPTALGGRDEIDLSFTLSGDEYVFEVFGGLDSDELFLPYLQGSIGLWGNTEVSLRVAPQVTVEDSEYQLYGLGIRHNLSQYFNKDSRFQVSAISNFNWTDLNLTIDRLELIANGGTNALAVLDGLLIDVYSMNAGLVSSYKINKLYLNAGLTGTVGWVDYKFTGEDTVFLELFNNTLTSLSERKYTLIADVGATIDLNILEVAAQFTYGDAANYNLGIYFKI